MSMWQPQSDRKGNEPKTKKETLNITEIKAGQNLDSDNYENH